jgi:hypothetical protein
MPDTDSRFNFDGMVVNPVSRPNHLVNDVGIGECNESKATRNLKRTVSVRRDVVSKVETKWAVDPGGTITLFSPRGISRAHISPYSEK